MCGGEERRLFPFSTIIPKTMLPIKGRPCIRIIVERLLNSGICKPEEIFLCPEVEDLPIFEHEFRDINIKYLASEVRLGTAGHMEKFKDSIGDDFLVHYGDCLIDIDYSDLVKCHSLLKNFATLAVTPRVRIEYGKVWLNGTGDFVEGMEEKPYIGGHAWTGIAVLSKDSVGFLRAGQDFARDVFPSMIRSDKRVGAYIVDKPWYDIGSFPLYQRANKEYGVWQIS